MTLPPEGGVAVHRYSFLLLACLAMVCPSTAVAQARTFPDTRDGIHVFSDQIQSGMTPAQYAFAAARLVGCQKMLLDDVRSLRALNPSFIVLHYQLGCGNGQEPFIDGNTWTFDWSLVNGREEWFMHQGGARLHMVAWNWYLMDIGSDGYRNYWIASCLQRMRDTECDGVFADSFTIDGYFNALSPDHPWFTDPDQCLANWVPALQAYGSYLHAALSAEEFFFLPNLGGLVTGWDTTDYADLGDGGMIEGFGAWGNDSYFDLADWRLQMDRTLALARAGKIILCQSYTSDAALNERLFLTGCYLLIKGARTYFNMIGAEHGEELLYYPEYGIPIGAYQGDIPASIDELYDAARGCYRRDYSNGMVLVNPGDGEADVADLGGTWELVAASGGGAVDDHGHTDGTLAYQPVTGVRLPAHSAAILLREAPDTRHRLQLSLDRDNFARSESLTLHWRLTPGSSVDPQADAYCAVMAPGGALYFYGGAFETRVRPIARSMAVGNASGSVGPFGLSGTRTGEYIWYGVLVQSGGNPFDRSLWISGLAEAPFSIY
ncbi:MAG: putative glycoside hydrolase [Candidatus Aureabacteria bacterium]|nr:putative glycoside hydrolase [Candidatus Auribacterota bacterium]